MPELGRSAHATRAIVTIVPAMEQAASESDASVRAAAFQFLGEQTRSFRGVVPRSVLERGFDWCGERVPLVGPQGIFKPRVLREVPLSLTTVPEVLGKERPYQDGFTQDDLVLYRYRGRDPDHRENRGLRIAMDRRIPLVYLFGLVPGSYSAHWPTYVVGDDPEHLCCTLAIEDAGSLPIASSTAEVLASDVRRSYALRTVRVRMHQQAFRARVLYAYSKRCSICSLRHENLLDAAHILPDGDPRGEPVVSNGLALCKLHHAAFDENIVGVTPDMTVAVRRDVMDEEDGPMLLHGLQGFDGQRLHVPRRRELQPNRDYLDERFASFSRAS